MRLISWNVQWGRSAHGDVNLSRTIDEARRLADFDVLCLQEVTRGFSVLAGHPGDDQFAELVTSGGTIAISATALTDRFAAASVAPRSNAGLMLEFLVDDVDADRDRIAALAGGLVMEPTTLPWGNRSMLFRDPDGTVINFFTPVTPEAVARFGGR